MTSQLPVRKLKFIFCLFLAYTCQIKAEKSFYRAAVFEYHTIRTGKYPLEAANENSKNLRSVIKKAKFYDADIVAFPENGITFMSTNKSELLLRATGVPDKSINLCNYTEEINSNDYKQYLQDIACAAKEASMYVVVNVHEKKKCNDSPNCPSDGFHIYNTNVVFDRQGTVISTYKKYNLFDSEKIFISTTEEAEMSTFTTDFNVTFGQFICFDIMFNSPSWNLVRQGVTDLLFTTHWFSELPFLSANQEQLGFSYANDVNLLAANLNFPMTSTSGSGIYAGKMGPLVVTETNKPGNILLVANVPKFKEDRKRYEGVDIDHVVYEFSESEMPTIKDHKHNMNWNFDHIENYTTVVYNPKDVVFNETICNNNLCCHFCIETEGKYPPVGENYYRYRMAVFEGDRLYGSSEAGIATCAVISCANDTIHSCGRVIDDPVQLSMTFKNVVITTPVHKNNINFIPSVYTMNLQIMDANSFSYADYTKDNNDNKKNEIQLTLTKPQKDLFAFGTYGIKWPVKDE